MFEKENADWLSELPSVTNKNNNTIHSSIKKTPNQASRKSNQKEVDSRQEAKTKAKV